MTDACRKVEAVFDAVRIVQSEANSRDYEPDERLLIDRTDVLLRDEPELMQQYSTMWKEARNTCAAYNSELKVHECLRQRSAKLKNVTLRQYATRTVCTTKQQ